MKNNIIIKRDNNSLIKQKPRIMKSITITLNKNSSTYYIKYIGNKCDVKD